MVYKYTYISLYLNSYESRSSSSPCFIMDEHHVLDQESKTSDQVVAIEQSANDKTRKDTRGNGEEGHRGRQRQRGWGSMDPVGDRG